MYMPISTEMLDWKADSDPLSPEDSALLSILDGQNAALLRDPRAVSLNDLRKEGIGWKDVSDVEWAFWGDVFRRFEDYVGRKERLLREKINQGVPVPVRGKLWQLFTHHKIPRRDYRYLEILRRTSPYEKLILRDIARTFPKHRFFADQNGPGQSALFHVLKAYSLIDPELGYCQGLSFVAGALLLNVRS